MSDFEPTSPLRSVNGYEILELIATGGMSRVYRALDRAGETVAVKVIQFDEMAADYERRLRREPEIQTGVGHNNIVRLIDWFRVGGEFFLVMEYIDGRSLWTIIHSEVGALPFERSRGYLRQVLPALAHLHELGIVHRDIKPANILVAHDDTAKLADFGIAKFTWQQGQTRTQVGLGTPEYMSPEQARGVGIDHRTDIYSLGITFFEMLTGQPPFVRDVSTPAAYSEIIQGILSQSVPDPRTLRADVPSGAAALIARATAKDPRERYTSAVQMLRALEAIDAESASPNTVVVPALISDAAGDVDPDLISADLSDASDVDAQPVSDMGAADHAARHGGAESGEPPQRSTSFPPVRVRPAGDMRSLLERPAVIVALVVIVLAGAAIAATQLYVSRPEVVSHVERPLTPVEIAQRTASSYQRYSLAHSIPSLAELYDRDSVRYFGERLLSRDSIKNELERDYSRVARTDSFTVAIDSTRARGDSAIDVMWRTTYSRMRNDSSRYNGATREQLVLTRLGQRWYIAEHSRRLLSGIAPDGALPERRVASAPRSTTAKRSNARRAGSAAPSRPSIRVHLGRDFRIEVDKPGKGNKAKKRRK